MQIITTLKFLPIAGLLESSSSSVAWMSSQRMVVDGAILSNSISMFLQLLFDGHNIGEVYSSSVIGFLLLHQWKVGVLFMSSALITLLLNTLLGMLFNTSKTILRQTKLASSSLSSDELVNSLMDLNFKGMKILDVSDCSRNLVVFAPEIEMKNNI